MQLRRGWTGATVAAAVWACGHMACAGTAGGRTVYEPTWESLDRHQTPTWFQDAKLGVFMYGPHPTEKYWNDFWAAHGKPDKKYSRASFGYRSAEKLTWDPGKIAQFVEDIGARYIVWSGDSASTFLTFPSRYADIDGSEFTTVAGPGAEAPDYTGELAAAVRARGLHFGIYRNYLHPGRNPYFLETMFEMIDRYQPNTLWLDESKFSFPTEVLRGRELLAYYYNHSQRQDEVACEDALGSYKGPTIAKRLVHGDWYRKEHSPPATGFSDGFYVRYERFRPHQAYRRHPLNQPSGNSAESFIEWLAHTASHGGNLEIAVDSASDEVFEWFRKELLPIGDWLAQNGEAVYKTRPWYDGVPQSITTEGVQVRFTVQGNALYVILFDRPGPQTTFPGLKAAGGTEVRLLGMEGTIPWEEKDGGLVLHPARGPGESGGGREIPGDHAFVCKITPRPQWAE